MVWKIDDPQGNEAGKIRFELVPYTRGVVLDIGCGPSKAFPHFIGVDNLADSRMFNIAMRPEIVVKSADRLSMFASQGVDAVFSSHLLEHLEDYKGALKEWWRVIRIGGHLCLYLPHKELYPNIGQEGANPDHKHDFLPDDIIAAMEELPGGWELIRNEARNEGQEYSFFQVYKKTPGREKVRNYERKPGKRAAVVRYGAFGDCIQASSVLPGLKEQGFHVTFYCETRGYDVIRDDPHIDEFVIQDKDQVPNHELGLFFEAISKKYDRFINLCESVEGSLLALADRANHRWPHAVRQKMMNMNYLELTHDLAGVPYKFAPRFYPDQQEIMAARREKDRHGPLIMWVLAGSSVHKTYPHQDTMLRKILDETDYKVMTVGDDSTVCLEAGWENESRIIRRAGKITIRQTMALAKICDLVIGPETGVMNAVSFETVPKVLFLSHSSVENLSRDWVNTISLKTPGLPCYPCHQLHFSFEFCKEHKESGTAQCQWDIGPDMCWDAIVQSLGLDEPKVAYG